MSTRLEHKTALAIGPTSNIGRAIATAFATEGAHVIVSGCSPTAAQAAQPRRLDATR